MNKVRLVAWVQLIVFGALLFGVYAQYRNFQSFLEGNRAQALVTWMGQEGSGVMLSFTDHTGKKYSVASEPFSKKGSLPFEVGQYIPVAYFPDNPMRVVPVAVLPQLKAGYFWWCAAILSGVGSLGLFFWDVVQSARRKKIKDGWQVLLWSLAKTRRDSFVVGFLLMAFSIFLTTILFSDQSGQWHFWQSMLLGLILLFSLVVGCMSLWNFFNLCPLQKSRLYQKIKNQDIVWVYERSVPRRQEWASAHYVMIGFFDGSLEQISVEKNHVAVLIQTLSHSAPLASVGYTHHLSNLFSQNPAALQSTFERGVEIV